MKFTEFDAVQAEIFAKCVEMKTSKGVEYANSDERFGNFNRLAERLGVSRNQVLYVYLTKHMDAIESYIRFGKVKSEPIEGRIVDAITYLTLLAGMIREDEGRIKVATQ